jgi:L-ribulokinase
MMEKYAIGVDFGTLSGRAVLVSMQTGEETASSVLDYPHAVMDKALPDGKKLGVDWALQHPRDYMDVLRFTIPVLLQASGVDKNDVIGLGIDITACTVMPVKSDGTPLCFLPAYESEPHAYVKLWKHHAAQEQANRLNETAHARGEKWIGRYGGRISSEWLFPKIWQMLEEAPEIYGAMDKFIEAGDWIVWQLTGNERRNTCMAGYKAIWHKREGYPSDAFFAALDPRLEHVVDEKLSRGLYGPGERAGALTEEATAQIGLNAGMAVAVANTDAHVCPPAVKITGAAKLLAIVGTSTCCMLLGDKERAVSGICGYVEDGILPGYFGYEAGQSCVGDHFDWFVKNCVPAEYFDAAKREGTDIHSYLQKLGGAQRPGESGLLALDWWNGNRSVLVDVDLTGMVLGMTLQTKPEEAYRALIEATAYGMRKIITNFEENGVPVNEVYAAGGIAEKSSFMMQIYADVLGKPIKISGSPQAPALAAAMYGAVAAGKEAGGFGSILEAAEKIGRLKDVLYTPDAENTPVYNKLYAEYDVLHDYLGRGANDVMKRLKNIKKEARAK